MTVLNNQPCSQGCSTVVQNGYATEAAQPRDATGLQASATPGDLNGGYAPGQIDSFEKFHAASLAELADHIQRTHHAYVRRELPRLIELSGRVAAQHGAADPRLNQVCNVLLGFAAELSSHMWKEEQVLFPMIRLLEASDEAPRFHCGSLAYPMRQMELEHSDADEALERLSELTDGFTPPKGACDSYRLLLIALDRLKRDMNTHVHKENNILFPRALAVEAQKQRASTR